MNIFNSNSKKLSRVVPKTNINKIEGATFANKLVKDFTEQNQLFSGSFTSVQNYDYETSFDSRTKKTFNSKIRTNPNITTIQRNEKDLVLGFRKSILDITANWVFKQPDIVEILNDARIKLTFTGVYLQGATEINPSNFDLYVNGVKVPTYMTIEHSETGVHLIINEFIGIDSTNKNKTNIYVKGKFL
jgi:hypothetical protein